MKVQNYSLMQEPVQDLTCNGDTKALQVIQKLPQSGSAPDQNNSVSMVALWSVSHTMKASRKYLFAC